MNKTVPPGVKSWDENYDFLRQCIRYPDDVFKLLEKAMKAKGMGEGRLFEHLANFYKQKFWRLYVASSRL